MIRKPQTNEIKGIAVLLLMIHHLLYRYMNDSAMMYEIVISSKVCVALFIFLSGYGVSKSYLKYF